MKLYHHEEKILNIIKYGPIVFVIIISFFFTQQFISQQQSLYDKEITAIEEKFLLENKFRIKEEIERVHKLISDEKNNSSLDLKKELKNRVENAHQIATNLYNQYKNTKTKQEIIQLIKNALRAIRFNNNRGYYYILNLKAINILHSLQPQLEGRDLYNIQDVKGNYFNHTTVELMNKEGEGFVSYFWHKPADLKEMYEKLTFNKVFKPYDLYIGTGEYIFDYEEDLKTKLLNQIQNIRYGNNGYIFIYDEKGKCLSHYKKELIGKNRINIQDKHGRFILQDLLNFTKKKNSGYITYISSIKTNDEIQSNEKISYVSLFRPWNWSLGTGFYLDSLNKIISQKKIVLEKNKDESFYNILKISTLITLLFILISFYVSKVLTSMFTQYKQDINDEINNTLEKEKLLIQQSKMAIMGEMMSMIAHQWRQPLSVISMGANNIMADIELKITDEKILKEISKEIILQTNELSKTIDDFRDFFKPRKLKEYILVEKVFEDTFNIIGKSLENNDILLIKEFNSIKKINTYSRELMQVFLNILKNSKEVLVDNKIEQKIISIKTSDNDNSVIIEISDNGGGIPLLILPKIFDPYYSTKDDKTGTGLGLYMCKTIVEKHLNGNIIASNKNDGACFTIIIKDKNND